MKPFIIANWKMNPQTLGQAKALFNSVKNGVKGIKGKEVIICPPFIYLPMLKGLSLGAQNCFWEREGAYTGEISCPMLKSLCQYVLAGHSERRKYFNEKDEINNKLKAVLDAKLIPVLCIGETQEQRNQDKTEAVLKEQIISALDSISSSRFSSVIIAYEPVWAIGTGNPCDVEEAQKMKLLIQKIISKIYSSNVSFKTPILYGGSVKSNNAESYVKEAGFNGLLVGGASLDAREFIKIVKQAV